MTLSHIILAALLGAIYGALVVYVLMHRRSARLTRRLLDLLDTMETDAGRLAARRAEFDADPGPVAW
jgi:fructose-specific phosphotransferase system IIC component